MLLLIAMLPGLAAAAVHQTRVQQGTLNGIEGSNGVAAFLGVPYAAAPVGNLRWRRPGAPAAWHSTRHADRFAANCMQQMTPGESGPWTSEYLAHGKVSEDCLFLNIWTPARGVAERLPVLVWIHGGAFSSGSASVPNYDGQALAALGVIVVSLNYRLGVFGFLSDSQLAAEPGQSGSGDYGLLDQIAALRWIRANIAAFGGDSGRITVAGQSAGAISIMALLRSPLAHGLFARAIIQSGIAPGLDLPSPEQAGGVSDALLRSSGAGSIAGLRRWSAAALLDASTHAPPLPGASGGFSFVPVENPHLLAAQAVNRVPLLVGMTADETSADPNYAAASEAQKSSLRNRALAATYFWAQSYIHSARSAVFLYYYDHAEPGPEADRYGAFHSSEIPYVFGTLRRTDRAFSSRDDEISAAMAGYWANFAATGDPNGRGLPPWPALLADEPQVMELGERFAPRPLMPADELQIFRAVVEAGGRIAIH
jgi:para-nitrobenzyl esterase